MALQTIGNFGARRLGATKIALSLPRFKLESRAELNEPLKATGINAVFHDGACEGFSGDPQLYVDKVIHKAVIEVRQ